MSQAMLLPGVCAGGRPVGMTRLQFWRDDKQVVRLICEKRYGEYPAWEVSVRRIGRGRGKHGAS